MGRSTPTRWRSLPHPLHLRPCRQPLRRCNPVRFHCLARHLRLRASRSRACGCLGQSMCTDDQRLSLLVHLRVCTYGTTDGTGKFGYTTRAPVRLCSPAVSRQTPRCTSRGTDWNATIVCLAGVVVHRFHSPATTTSTASGFRPPALRRCGLTSRSTVSR